MSKRDYIPVYSPDFDVDERTALAQTAWTSRFLTANKKCETFEKEMCKYHNRRHAVMVNSGSSAILIAVASMEWKRGTKIATPACTFGTTLSPLIIYGLTPVFIDVLPGTYNVDPEKLYDAVSADRDIIGCVIPHTLGNPVHPGIWSYFPDNSIEDACDAFGSRINSELCGKFGNISCFSFFPAHHLTSIEGGLCITNHPDLWRRMQQYSRWGRDCWCPAGEYPNGLCGNRFKHELDDGTPLDHKYLFGKAGFNVKADELRASVALTQLKKVERYDEIRKRNFQIIYDSLRELGEHILLPQIHNTAQPSWFAFPITIKKEGKREAITQALESKGVGTRHIFMGNATRHPMMKGVEYLTPHGLENSDKVLHDAFCVGLNQTITEEEADYIGKTVAEVVAGG